MSDQPTRPSRETKDAERAEAASPAEPDRMPTPEEERVAEQHDVDPTVAEHEREMAERGASQEGEGRLP
jgi:hypothetical protein